MFSTGKRTENTNAPAATTAEAITMADPGVYSEKLSYFSRMLRREGMSVGPKETADACEKKHRT